MALNTEKFQSSGSLPGRAKGKQNYSYDSEADTLGTVLGSGFFNGVLQNLQVGDAITIIHPLGVGVIQVLAISALGVVTTELVTGGEKGVQDITDSGAIDIVTRRTNIDTDASGAMTLVDGDYIGQIKIVTLEVDGGNNAVITPTTRLGYATITMADAGDTVTLEWTGALGWGVTSQGGLGTGPVVA